VVPAAAPLRRCGQSQGEPFGHREVARDRQVAGGTAAVEVEQQVGGGRLDQGIRPVIVSVGRYTTYNYLNEIRR
jgi:hypothetical protein